MTSLLVIFRAFLFIFFVPTTLNLKKNPASQLIKKFWPYEYSNNDARGEEYRSNTYLERQEKCSIRAKLSKSISSLLLARNNKQIQNYNNQYQPRSTLIIYIKHNEPI